MVIKIMMDKILGYLLTTHILIDLLRLQVRPDVFLGDSRSLSKMFGTEVIFGGSEVGDLLISGTPLALSSLEEHALPQVGKMFEPSLYAGVPLQICKWLLKRTRLIFWASYSPHTFPMN